MRGEGEYQRLLGETVNKVKYISVATYAEIKGLPEALVRTRINKGEIKASQERKGTAIRIPWSEVGPVPSDAFFGAPECPGGVVVVEGPTGRDKPKKERLDAAAIRTGWSILFPALGFGVSVIAETYSSLPVPQPWTGIVIGALAYGVKKYVWPDTQF